MKKIMAGVDYAQASTKDYALNYYEKIINWYDTRAKGVSEMEQKRLDRLYVKE
jgi:hypothetical protein